MGQRKITGVMPAYNATKTALAYQFVVAAALNRPGVPLKREDEILTERMVTNA